MKSNDGRHRPVPRAIRRLAAASLAATLVVAACGGSAGPASSENPVSSGSGLDKGGTLTPGLAAGLSKLTSYRFTESNVGAPGVAAGSNGGSYALAGTVVNAPVISIWIRESAAQFVVIGNAAWTSVDGSTWSPADTADLSLADLMPAGEYVTWFDAKASDFTAVGEEVKNGIACVHYQGDSTLSSIYTSDSSGPTAFRADVWIARDGGFPVSGIYGFSGGTTDPSSSWGFSFDITDVNSPTNAVAAPTYVVAFPT